MRLLPLLTITVIAGLLAGCQTDGGPPNPLAELASYRARADAKAAEPPMTRAVAARDCWAAADKTLSGATLDRRADFATRCIDDKLKAAPAP